METLSINAQPGRGVKDVSAATESLVPELPDITVTKPETIDAKGSTAEAIDAEQGIKDQNKTAEPLSAADVAKLKDLLGDTTSNELIVLYKKILADPKSRPQSHGFVKFPQISDKAARSAIHSVCLSLPGSSQLADLY